MPASLNIIMVWIILCESSLLPAYAALENYAVQNDMFGLISRLANVANGEKREKRATLKQNPFLFTRGLNALNQLLFKAKRVWTPSKKYRKYEKIGDVGDAVKDFYSVNPANIQGFKSSFQLNNSPTEGFVFHGTIGDRDIRLLMKGDGYSRGRPVLEVTETMKTSKDHPYIDRIIYNEN